MTEVILTKRELAALIQEGTISVHCPNCATDVYLRLESLTYAKPAPEQKKSEESAVIKCIECGKPISEYAYAVRKGLCTNCWGLFRGAPSKPESK